MRFRHVIVVATLLGLLPSSGSASQIKIRFEDRSADRMIARFEAGPGRAAPSAAEIAATPGYALLFDQIAAGRRPRPSRDALAAELEAALTSEDGRAGDFALDDLRARPRRYREALLAVRRVRKSLQWRIADRLNEVLPPGSDFESTVHLVVGGRVAGAAFSDRTDLVVRLDDFVRSGGGTEPVPGAAAAVDEKRLAATLAHELWHVGFRAAGGLPPRPTASSVAWREAAVSWGPELVGEVWRAMEPPLRGRTRSTAESMAGVDARLRAWVPPSGWAPRTIDRLIAVLSRMQNEGTAVHAAGPLDPGVAPGRAGISRSRWMGRLDDDFAVLARIADRATHGAPPAEIDGLAAEAFRGNGPLYRVGAQMAQRIDERAGRRPFHDAVRGGPLEFLEIYLQTRPTGKGQIDRETAELFRRLIREVRAVAAFDPRE